MGREFPTTISWQNDLDAAQSPTTVTTELCGKATAFALPQKYPVDKRRPPGMWLLPFMALTVVVIAVSISRPSGHMEPLSPCTMRACTSWAPIDCFKEPICTGVLPTDPPLRKLQRWAQALPERLHAG